LPEYQIQDNLGLYTLGYLPHQILLKIKHTKFLYLSKVGIYILLGIPDQEA